MLPMPTSCPGKWASLKGKYGFPQSPFFRGICQLFGVQLWAEVALKKKCEEKNHACEHSETRQWNVDVEPFGPGAKLQKIGR